jgi:hypothetical protein
MYYILYRYIILKFGYALSVRKETLLKGNIRMEIINVVRIKSLLMKMKKKKKKTVNTVPKYNSKKLRKETTLIPLIHKYMTAYFLAWYFNNMRQATCLKDEVLTFQ